MTMQMIDIVLRCCGNIEQHHWVILMVLSSFILSFACILCLDGLEVDLNSSRCFGLSKKGDVMYLLCVHDNRTHKCQSPVSVIYCLSGLVIVKFSCHNLLVCRSLWVDPNRKEWLSSVDGV